MFLEQEAIFKSSDDEVVDCPSGVDDGGSEDESLACTISASPLSEPTPNTKAEAVLIAAGRVLALSWYREEPIGVMLSPAMCKLLLGRADLIEWTDLSAVIITRKFRVLEECMAAKPATKDDAEAGAGATSAAGTTARTGTGNGDISSSADADADAAGGDDGGDVGIDPPAATAAAAAAAAVTAAAHDQVALFAKFKMFVLAQLPTTEQHFVLPSRAAQRADIRGSADGVDAGDSEAAIVTAIRKAQGNPRLTLSELLATATNGTPSASSTTTAAAAVAFREDSAFHDGGEEMMVTASNVEAFVHAWTVKELVTNTVEQIELMQQGIAQVRNRAGYASSTVLNLLPDGGDSVCLGELGDEGWKQFQKAVCGSNEIDVEEWKDCTDVVCDEIDDGRAAAAVFWEVVEKLSFGLKQKLLIYWCSKFPPAGGLKMLGSKLKLVLFPPERSSVPYAGTCFGSMKIPATTDEGKMQAVVDIAIAHCYQFGDE